MRNAERPAIGVLVSLCLCHLINDLLQSLLVSIYPTIKEEFQLSFTQIGLVTLAYPMTASLLQPAVGLYADRRPLPFSLPAGTLFTLVGLIVMSEEQGYPVPLAPRAVE